MKTELCNRMGDTDTYLNNALICTFKMETYDKVKEENVMARL